MPTSDFRSDNVGTAAPEILAAMVAANRGAAGAYGADDLSAAVQRRYGELFETRVDVFAVPTGTAANAMSLAACTPPWGAIYCHPSAHAHTSECAATEMYTQGAKFMPVAGDHGRIQQALLEQAVQQAGIDEAHRSQPATITVTQSTEWGTVYRLSDLDAMGAVAGRHGLAFHMDGARFANSVAGLGCTPAEMTWRRGVDILSFGVTKNGGLLCDAIVVFKPELAKALKYRLRRSGYGWSKMRFAAAQLLAYVEDDLWLVLARRANRLAARLAAGATESGLVQLVAPVETNEVFVRAPAAVVDALDRAGILAQPRGDNVLRLICRFDHTDAEIERCVAAMSA